MSALRISYSEAASHRHLRLRDLLRAHAYERREVVLASGKRSNFYIDCRRVVLTAEGHFLGGWLMHYAIRQLCPEAIGVGGMSLGADPLVSSVSLVSHLSGLTPLDGFYVRKQPKGHGTGRVVEGAAQLAAGAPVVVLEDVVTSGGSSLQAVERAQQAGFEPRLVLALVDRLEGGREAISARLPLVSLFTASDFASAEEGADLAAAEEGTG